MSFVPRSEFIVSSLVTTSPLTCKLSPITIENTDLFIERLLRCVYQINGCIQLVAQLYDVRQMSRHKLFHFCPTSNSCYVTPIVHNKMPCLKGVYNTDRSCFLSVLYRFRSFRTERDILRYLWLAKFSHGSSRLCSVRF